MLWISGWFPSYVDLQFTLIPAGTVLSNLKVFEIKHQIFSFSTILHQISNFQTKKWIHKHDSNNIRVSHETWQLVNSCECLLPYTVLIIKDFSLFNSLKKIFYSNKLYFYINISIISLPWNIFIILFGIK